MKGQNGISPCRICEIKGIRFNRTYYVPLRREKIPGAEPHRYYPSDLPIHTHEKLLDQAREVKMADKNARREELAKTYGIKGVPVLSCISSISFPSSFPLDFMHLIWENLIPNLIEFWTGAFKDLDHEGKDYLIEPHIWGEIGAATATSRATIPSAFGALVPNIATKRHEMSAEMYANWTLFIAPIVLCGRFKRPQYYKHFMQLVKLLKLCLAFEISEAMLDQIDEGFQLWVEDYEKWASRISLSCITLKPIQIVLRKLSHSTFRLSFDHPWPSSHCMGYKGSWSCLDLLGICYGTTLQHITSIDQKQTPPLCIYCFFCDHNCTTQSNTTIV